MNKLLSISVVLLLLSLIGCKKENDIVPSTGGVGTTTPTGNYAVFSSRQAILVNGTNVSNQPNFSNAYVSNSILINDNPTVGSLLNVGSVSLNGTIFQKNGFSVSNMYRDSTTNTHNTPHNWIISGSGSVSSFSYSNTNPYPTYTGYNSIADSFVVSNNISIPLNNYNGADYIQTYFVTISGTSTNTAIQTLTNNPSSLTFTASDLATIGSGKTVALIIDFYKNNVQNINGKNYNFRTGYQVVKSNIKFK